jgi:hypothetical protein
MPNISKENKVVTLINVFTVEPANQQKVVDMLVEPPRRLCNTYPDSFPRASTRVSTESAL